MNMKSKLATLFTLLLCLCLVLSLVGCGGSSGPQSMSRQANYTANYAASSSAAPMSPSPQNDVIIVPEGEGNDMAMNSAIASDETAPAAPPVESDRKLVKNAQMILETKEFDTVIPQLIKMVEAVGGYVENQSVDGRSMHTDTDYYERGASITARVPADKLSAVTSQMGTLCNVSSQSESIDDITDRYFDAAAHLEMLKVQEARLLELLGKAETLENIIQLEQALTNCQYEIESLSGQIRRMDSQVSYSTLRLTVNEVVDYTITQEKPKNFVERLGDAFVRSGRNLASATESILFFLIVDGPVLAIYLLFWGVIAYLVYRILQKRRARIEAKRQAHSIPPIADSSSDSNENS